MGGIRYEGMRDRRSQGSCLGGHAEADGRPRLQYVDDWIHSRQSWSVRWPTSAIALTDLHRPCELACLGEEELHGRPP